MKIGVVLQGLINDDRLIKKNLEYLTKYVPKEDILVSTWDNFFGDLGVKTIRQSESKVRECTPHFELLNNNNTFLQVYSTSAGIAALTQDKEYDCIIKLRTDEYYEDYTELISRLHSDNRIHCSSIFFRKDLPFHIGDHVIAGPTEDIYNMFRYTYDELVSLCDFNYFVTDSMSPKYNNRLFAQPQGDVSRMHTFNATNIAPEHKLTFGYLTYKGIKNIVVANHLSLMQKFFVPIDVKEFKQFSVAVNSLELKLDRDLLDNFENVMSNSQEYACFECPQHIICPKRIRQSIILRLLRASITDNSQLYDLNDDVDIYCSLYKPHLLTPETKGINLL